MRAVAVALALGTSVGADRAPEDQGYELLFEDSTGEVDWQCWDTPSLPSWLNGSFILPTVAQFSYGGLSFRGALDGFGKLHRFQASEGQVCLVAKMMRTGYYNKSRELGTVPPNMLFFETEPPRASCGFPGCNAMGPNDNNYVNTVRIGDTYSAWSDTPLADGFDPYTLDLQGTHTWTDSIGHFAHIPTMGTAHPVRRDGTGDWVTLQVDAAPTDGLGLGNYVDVMTISDETPNERKRLYSSKKMSNAVYFHSFGVTHDYVVLPYQPLGLSMTPIVQNKGMSEAFHQLDPLVTTFEAVPFDGGEPLQFTAPEPFTFVHLVNSYQNDTGIVIDMNVLTNAEPWITLGDLYILRNKTRRDTNAKQEVWRYVLHIQGPQAGAVTRERITKEGRGIEFPKINMLHSTREYCIYYGQEWWHNDEDFASMAVVKHDVCRGSRDYWHRPSYFPMEASFVPRPGATEEDDGVLLFAGTDGVSGESSFVVVNATSMQTLVEQPIPVRVTFATHGEWSEGLVGRTGPPKSIAGDTAAALFV